jgi:hypothetical protein
LPTQIEAKLSTRTEATTALSLDMAIFGMMELDVVTFNLTTAFEFGQISLLGGHNSTYIANLRKIHLPKLNILGIKIKHNPIESYNTMQTEKLILTFGEGHLCTIV